MTVVSITPVDKRRCKVLLEEGFALILYRGEIKKYGIEEQGDISEECVQEIIRDVLCKRARERVLNLLKNADKTEQQIRRKLKDGGYPQEAVEYAVSFVKEHHYIDDREYAKRYAECAAGRKSRKQIAYDLRQKGIDGEVISQVLEGTGIDEESQIAEILKKRGFGGKDSTGRNAGKNGLEARKEFQKTAAYLCRKGFSWEVIRRVMGEISEDSGEFY